MTAVALPDELAAELDLLASDYETWAAECYRIRDKRGVIRPLMLNPVQRAIGDAERAQLAMRGEARTFVLKGRQGGVTTDQQGRNLFQIWSEPNFDALTLAHTTEDTEKIFLITQRAIEHFPPALLPKTGGKESTEVSFPGLDSHFFTGTAGSKRTGRGLTLKRFHGSEFAFWDDPEGILGTVGPALVPWGSVVTLETTASGYDSPAHLFWKKAQAGENGYRALFFPWWQCDAENYRRPLLESDELGPLSDEEQELVRAHGLDLEQIKWRREKMHEYGRVTFLQEYAEDAETCWVAAGGLFYDAERLKLLLGRAPKPLRTELGGALELYAEALLPGERAILGGDVAEGGGGDRSTAVVRGFPTGRKLAAYQSNTVEPKEYAGVVNALGRRFGLAYLVIEKNAHGITVLRHLRDDHNYPSSRIYHRQTFDQPGKPPSLKIGWATTGETKPLLLDAGRELLAAAAEGTYGVPSAGVVRDAFGVRRDKHGKIELTGRDLLVAEMLAWLGRSADAFLKIRDYKSVHF